MLRIQGLTKPNIERDVEVGHEDSKDEKRGSYEDKVDRGGQTRAVGPSVPNVQSHITDTSHFVASTLHDQSASAQHAPISPIDVTTTNQSSP